jgi:sulfite reductase alpha subunit-like flavoprotein
MLILRFNWAHRKLYNRLVQLGARSICDRGEADEQYPEGVDGTFVPWSLNLKTRLLEEYPLPNGVQPVPDDIIIEPKWVLDFVVSSGDNTNLESQTSPIPQDEPPLDLIPISNGITATVHSNNRLTPQSHFQDTRHLILSLSGNHKYEPGATVTIYPKNFPNDVSEFIKHMGWDSIADKPLKFVSTRTVPTSMPPIAKLQPNTTLTLRTLLTNHLDIMSIPRRSFFAHLLNHTTDPMHIERLHEFISPDLIDELYDYTTRPRRSILEVLADFSSVQFPWQTICSIIPPLRGRQFSIASGGALKSTSSLPGGGVVGEEQKTRVDLLVAIVRYRTIIRRIRHGVATRYISTLKPGQELCVTLQPSALGVVATADVLRRPVVMIAPGTGVAPMRSLVWERKMLWEDGLGQIVAADGEKRSYRDVLFFGCRKKGFDEYFRDEWQEEALNVDVFTAWSQEQARIMNICGG